MSDVYPVDYTTPVGRVRKYIPDVVQLEDPKDPLAPASYMWSDDAILSFIADELPVGETEPTRATIWRAAASMMIATANNENLILKKLTTDDLQTDGPSVAKALIAAAQELIKRAATDESGADEETFTIIAAPARDSYSRSIWGL